MERTYLEESTRFVVNSDYFSPRDYTLFVESLETIWRVQRQRKLRQANGEQRKRNSSSEEDIMASSEEDAYDDEFQLRSDAKKIMLEKAQVDDENYFSGSSANSPLVGTHCYVKPNVNGTDVHNISDSEDSGFYPVGPIYENVQPIKQPLSRRHSSLDKMQGTLRSRLIKIVRKHSMLQKRKEGDKLLEMQNNKKKFKFKTLSLRRKPKTHTTDAKQTKHAQEADVNFITRALSYLTF